MYHPHSLTDRRSGLNCYSNFIIRFEKKKQFSRETKRQTFKMWGDGAFSVTRGCTYQKILNDIISKLPNFEMYSNKQ